jgi:predicted PurR-regulated permease PerM
MLELLNQRKETEMQTWAIWTFGLLAFSAVTKALVIGFINYPRVRGRGIDVIDMVILFAWLVWGACAIW